MSLLHLLIALTVFYGILAYVKRRAPAGEGQFWLVWAVLCALSVILFAFKSKVGLTLVVTVGVAVPVVLYIRDLQDSYRVRREARAQGVWTSADDRLLLGIWGRFVFIAIVGITVCMAAWSWAL